MPGTTLDPPSPAVPPFDDPALLVALRAGEAAAFERFVREVTPRVLPVARRLMNSDADAEDAVQDAFLSAFKNLTQFDGKSKLSTWMHRITVNACLMKRRARSRRPERAIEDLLPTFDHTGHQTNPARAWNAHRTGGIEGDEAATLLRAMVDELPESYRTVLMLRDIEGLSTEEAASALEITPNSVKIRLHRARLALKELLDPHFAPIDPTPKREARS